MKKNRFFIVLLTLLLAAWAWAPAQSQDRPALALTLEDCLRLALKQNPFYLASQERIAGARAQLSAAASGFFPQLTAAGLRTLDEKLFVLEFPSIIPGQPPTRMSLDFTKDYQFSLSLNLPLFAGGRLIAGYKQATYNMEATKETVRQSRQDTVFNVKSSFYGYLLAREF
ncbi:MAG TPA: TolC family protein, partial [Acidobacteriota bacterium]